MKKIYSIPFGSNLIDVLKGLILAQGKDLSKTAIVFAGKRPSLYLKRELADNFQKPFYSPSFFSIEEFLDYIASKICFDYSDVEYADAVWLMYQSVQKSELFGDHDLKRKGFGEFFPWGRYILDFIDQLDMENIPNARLRSLEKNAEIGYDVPESINRLLMNISILREAFHKRLKEEKLFTRGYKHLCSLEALKEADLGEFEMIWFAGLFAVGGAEREVIRHVWQRGKGEIIVEGDLEDWPILKQFVSYIGAETEKIRCEIVEQQAEAVKVYAGFDTHSEVMKAYEILRNVDSDKTAIVLPFSESLFPLLTFAIDRIDKKYNISLGYPFVRTSVFDLMANILNAQLAKRKGDWYAANSYLQVILHPFVKNLTTKGEIRALIFYIERSLTGDIQNAISGKSFITLSEIESIAESGEEYATEALRQIHKTLFRGFDEARDLYEMAARLEDVLQLILEFTPMRSYILSGEIFKEVYGVIERLKQARFCRECLHTDDGENKRILCDFLLQYLRAIALPFETRPVEQLEIVGVLETRNINFDTVVMLDVNEGVIPQPKRIDPLIPLGIYDKLGIPSPEFNEEIYRYHFYRLIRSAKRVHLLYIDADDRQRSRYIEQIMWEEEKRKKRLGVIPVENVVYRINLRPRHSLPVIEKTGVVIEHLRNMTYSPSAIDEYISCPVFFFYGSVLKFEQKRSLTEDIDASDRGNIIHRILLDTFTHLINKEIDHSMYAEAVKCMNEAIERSFEHKVVTGDYYLFKALTEYKLEAYLKKCIRDTAKPFTIVMLEEPVRGALTVNDTPVQLKGRIDRIDLSRHDHEYTILDYKTGGSKQYSSNIIRKIDPGCIGDIHKHIESFQLPLYVKLFHDASGTAVEQINAKLVLLKDNEEDLLFQDRGGTGRELLLDAYVDGIKTVLADILDYEKPFRPFEDSGCDTCVFTGLCHQ